MVSAVTLAQAETPTVVLDRTRLAANARRMIARARRLGVRIRPHLKTLKSIDVARIAVDPEHGGIAAATLNEAAYFAGHGLTDIQLAVCLPPSKFPRAAAILRQAPRFSFFVESPEVARAAADFARTTGAPLRVWIEIDSGEHRTGVAPDDPGLIEIAAALGQHVHLDGVATHAGQGYADLEAGQIAAIAECERAAVVAAAERLRAAGYAVAGVSAGSTPTVAHSRSAAGLTEWRAGVYLAGDLYQAGIGTLNFDDLALSVLASVISHHRDRGQMLIDAGGLALSKDYSTQQLKGRGAGYGLVTDLHGRPVFGALQVVDVHQEHGDIRGVTAAQFDALPVGSRVRIYPNHACLTAAMYSEYLVTDGDDRIAARWDRTNGWS
jgi:D-serine deaminase-like pyridoxal phosphate-dependent protein